MDMLIDAAISGKPTKVELVEHRMNSSTDILRRHSGAESHLDPDVFNCYVQMAAPVSLAYCFQPFLLVF